MGAACEHDSPAGVEVCNTVLYHADQLVMRWVAERIDGFQVCEGYRALGVVKGGQIAAGVVYDNYNGIHCQASIAAEPGTRWASRPVLRRIFSYPFTTMDVRAVSVLVSTANLASLNLATKLGFWPEAIIKFAAYDGGDLLVLKMFRNECRWLKDGQRRITPSTPGRSRDSAS